MPLLGTHSSVNVRYEPPGDWTLAVGANGEHIATFNGTGTGTVTIDLDDGKDPHDQQEHTNLPSGSTATSSNGTTSVQTP